MGIFVKNIWFFIVSFYLESGVSFVTQKQKSNPLISDGLAKWLRARMLSERSEVQIPHQENKSEKSLPQRIIR